MDDGAIGPESAVRVSDADRERVADRLAGAQAEGRLALPEFDERVRAAYAAVTRADLVPLTADLPDGVTASPAVGRPVDGDAGVVAGRPSRRGLAAAVRVWAVVSAANLAVWTVVALTAPGPVYPWWIWVAGPWGAMLALRATAGRPGPPRTAAFPPSAPFPGLTCMARPRR